MSKYFSSFFGNIKDNVNSYRISRTQRKIDELKLLIEHINFVIKEDEVEKERLERLLNIKNPPLSDDEKLRNQILSDLGQENDDDTKNMLFDLNKIELKKLENDMLEVNKYLEKKKNKLIKLKTQMEQLKQGRIIEEEEEDDVNAKTRTYKSNKVVPFGGNRRSRKKRRSKKKRR
jgi:hypothetical protein